MSDGHKKRALLALLLLVPAPSLGAWCGLELFAGTPLGAAIFGLSKLWVIALPLAWRVFVERKPISWSPARQGGFGMAVASGLAIAAFIAGAYALLGGHLIDRALLVRELAEAGLTEPLRYGLGVAYWVFVNSVVEEYVWRWFCVRQCEALVTPRVAVVLSAVFFTLHHVVAMRIYLDPLPVILCSLGVFIGGLLWSWMYMRYRSIWPGWVSHAIVDVAVFGVGAFMLFGAG